MSTQKGSLIIFDLNPTPHMGEVLDFIRIPELILLQTVDQTLVCSYVLLNLMNLITFYGSIN